MGDLPKLSDLVTEAISSHGKATADLANRLGQGDAIDWVAEAASCLGQVTQTGAKFLLFWDNIATLVAADPDGPLTFEGPKKCAEGEKKTFKVPITGMTSATVQSGLRRRGDDKFTIAAQAITAKVEPDGIAIQVVCSGAPRGLYEGALALVGPTGAQTKRLYNVYIEPA
jgi:hypothetical protein